MTRSTTWTALVLLSAIVLGPSEAPAELVTLTDTVAATAGDASSSPFSSSPIIFNFSITPSQRSQGAAGQIWVQARGDIDGGSASPEGIDVLIDSLVTPLVGTVFTRTQDPPDPPIITTPPGQQDSDDWLGNEGLTVAGGILEESTDDLSVTLQFFFDTTGTDGINVLHDTDFLTATLTYSTDLVVPEPSTLCLSILGAGVLGALVDRRRRRGRKRT